MEAVRAVETIKNICRGFGDCEGCPFFLDESEYCYCILMAFTPDHWILPEHKEERERE